MVEDACVEELDYGFAGLDLFFGGGGCWWGVVSKG